MILDFLIFGGLPESRFLFYFSRELRKQNRGTLAEAPAAVSIIPFTTSVFHAQFRTPPRSLFTIFLIYSRHLYGYVLRLQCAFKFVLSRHFELARYQLNSITSSKTHAQSHIDKTLDIVFSIYISLS